MASPAASRGARERARVGRLRAPRAGSTRLMPGARFCRRSRDSGVGTGIDRGQRRGVDWRRRPRRDRRAFCHRPHLSDGRHRIGRARCGDRRRRSDRARRRALRVRSSARQRERIDRRHSVRARRCGGRSRRGDFRARRLRGLLGGDGSRNDDLRERRDLASTSAMLAGGHGDVAATTRVLPPRPRCSSKASPSTAGETRKASFATMSSERLISSRCTPIRCSPPSSESRWKI